MTVSQHVYFSSVAKTQSARSPAAARQRGVALAIVVWFIAGMSLLVAGIVSHARIDTRMTQLHVAKAKVVAAGDGGIKLMIAELAMARPDEEDATSVRSFTLGDMQVQVTLVSSSGLIDLNRALEPELIALLSVAAGLPESRAETQAASVIKWRAPKSGAKQSRLTAVEDLLRVDGIDRTTLDAIRDYVTVSGSSGRLEWAKAPPNVMEVLRRVDAPRADAIESSDGVSDGSGMRAAANASTLRADAIVRYGDKLWLRRLWLSRGGGGASKLPWKTIRTEAPRVVQSV